MAENPSRSEDRKASAQLAAAVAEIERGNTPNAVAALATALEAMSTRPEETLSRRDDATRDAELLRIQQRFSEGHLHEAALFSSIALLRYPEILALKQLDSQIQESIRTAEQRRAALPEPLEEKAPAAQPQAPPPQQSPPPAAQKRVEAPPTAAPATQEIRRNPADERAQIVLSQVIALESSGALTSLKEALKLGNDYLQKNGEHPLIRKAHGQLERRIKEREAEFQKLIAQVEDLASKEQFDEAKAVLHDAHSLDPQNKRLEQLKVELSKSKRKNVWSRVAAEKNAVQSAKSESSEPLRIGQVLANRYEILAPLGTGGMSAVYKARDVLTNHAIAIKVVLPLFSKEEALREKFKKELLVARRLTHPNVVRIHDIGEHQGLLFISMELVDGLTIGKLVAEKKRLSAGDFMKLFHQFAPALGYIHSQKVLHRDIKPQNLMIDSKGTLKVMDFGIARDLGSDKTTALIPMGTPAYMSPELLNGGTLSPASDIYSSGIMFYEMLTGAKPFGKASPYERFNKPAPRISEILPEVPKEIDDAVHRCMQPQPDRRFQSVEEMMEAFSKRAAAPGVKAGTLASLMLDDPAPLSEALLAFIRVAEQVSAIHAAGGRPILTPYAIRWSGGAAEVDASSSSGERNQTRAVNCKYASAEEFQEPAPTRERGMASDAYVLGFIFYEILLGQKRFRDQFAECLGSDADLQWLNWHGDSTRSATALREAVPDFPAEVSDVIAGMMKKAVEGRPSLAAAVSAIGSVRSNLLRESGKTMVLSPEPAVVVPKPPATPKKVSGTPGWIIPLVAVVLLAVAAWFIWKSLG